MKVGNTNHLKSIADRKYFFKYVIYFPSICWNYVMPTTVNSYRTRSSVKFCNILNVHNKVKGTETFARCFSTFNHTGLKCEVTKMLTNLKLASINNNIERVNFLVKAILNMPNFWIYCYESIKSKPGMFTAGGFLVTDGKNITFDGIDLDFFHKLSKLIISGRFQFKLIRKVEIPKKKGGIRQFDIADSRDKIIQKGMAIILEQLSEHKFFDCNFGARKGRSCHDALKFIKKKVPSGLWAIEGDISQCFDNFNQKRLVSLVKKKYVSLQIFIDLLYKALKAKIVTINSSEIKKIGTPQGSVVSPILCNIYLHELDLFILEGASLNKYRNKKQAATNYQYIKFLKPTADEINKAQGVKRNAGKKKMWKYYHKLRSFKIKSAKKLNINKVKHIGINRKLVYLRYVDDFIIFVWGTKNDCLEIKMLVKIFLKANLDLNLSIEKTKITYLKKEKAQFLGFQI